LSSFGFILKALFSIDFENWKRRFYFMVDLDFWFFWKIENEGLNSEGYKGLSQKLSTKKQNKFKICTTI